MNHRSHAVTLFEEVLTPKQTEQLWARAAALNERRRTRVLWCENTARCDVPQGRQVAEEAVNL